MARHPTPRHGGFTLAELMVTVALIGILASITIVVSGNAWRRERSNAVVFELAGWLEAIRNASQRLSGSYCEVSFVTTPATKAAGDILATVQQRNSATNAVITPQTCSPEANLRITAFATSADRYAVALSPATPTTLAFNPRGAVSATASTDLKILLSGSTLLRCVRITPTAGLIRLGSNNAAADTAAACTSFTTF